MLPDTFDLEAVEAFLKQRDTADNVRKCMKKIRRLVSGQGVSHKDRSDVFMQGTAVLPSHDLEDIRLRANKWLPYTRATGRVDRTGGWTLNHPIAKLQLYKEEVLLSGSSPAPPPQPAPPVAVAVPVVAPRTLSQTIQQSGYIYCFNTLGNPNIYKAGMTHKFIYDERLTQYDGCNKPDVIVGTLFVQNAREAENQLLAALKSSGVLEPVRRMGKEWFRATDEVDILRRHVVISGIMSNVCHAVHRKRRREEEEGGVTASTTSAVAQDGW